jgi:murein DD-endopeptidase MepM/ murein hydrolase activator NlpD
MLAAFAAAGCFSSAPAPSFHRSGSRSYRGHGTYTVARGDTIYHIAHKYGVSPERLMAANAISDPRDLRVGQTLVIPASGFASASAVASPELWPSHVDRQFAWPVLGGTMTSPFGMRHGVMHDGIDIAAPAGTPVRAADDGTVIYSGRLRGYGNVVIVQHSRGYVTVYGHNERNLVREGERVARGQEIAQLGATGRATGPNLHFEIRYDNQAENPLAYLPAREPAGGASFALGGG